MILCKALPVDPDESHRARRQPLVPRHAFALALDPPRRAAVAAAERVGRMRAGHEEGGLFTRRAGRKRHMDVAQQPGRHAGSLEGRGLDVEILPLGVETEARHVAVGDADPQTRGPLPRGGGDPADRRIFSRLRGARAGKEMHRLPGDLVGLHLRGGQQVDGACALGLLPKPLPDLGLRAGVMVVVARHDDDRRAREALQNLRRPADVPHRDADRIEEVTGDDEKLGLPRVGRLDEPREGREPLLDQRVADGGGVLLERQPDMVIGRVQDADRHGTWPPGTEGERASAGGPAAHRPANRSIYDETRGLRYDETRGLRNRRPPRDLTVICTAVHCQAGGRLPRDAGGACHEHPPDVGMK